MIELFVCCVLRSGKSFARNGYVFFESNDAAREAVKKFDDYQIAPRVYLSLKPCPDAQTRAASTPAPAFTAKDPARIEKDLALASRVCLCHMHRLLLCCVVDSDWL